MIDYPHVVASSLGGQLSRGGSCFTCTTDESDTPFQSHAGSSFGKQRGTRLAVLEMVYHILTNHWWRIVDLIENLLAAGMPFFFKFLTSGRQSWKLPTF